MCDVSADLSGLRNALIRAIGPSGVYWYVDVSVVFKFGGTELRAALSWTENVSVMNIYIAASAST